MRYLLDRLHQELLALLPQNSFSTRHVSFLAGVKTSVVTAVFGGVLQVCPIWLHSASLDCACYLPLQMYSFSSRVTTIVSFATPFGFCL